METKSLLLHGCINNATEIMCDKVGTIHLHYLSLVQSWLRRCECQWFWTLIALLLDSVFSAFVVENSAKHLHVVELPRGKEHRCISYTVGCFSGLKTKI